MTGEPPSSPEFNEGGNPQGVVSGQTPDHSPAAWEQLRADLAAAEERYQRLIHAVTDYVFVVEMEDGHAVRTTHGPNCVAVTGYTAEEFDRDPWLWLNMVVGEDRERVQRHAERLLAGEDPGPLEHRLQRKDGSVRWVRNTPVIHRDAEGRLVSYDGLIQDITDRCQAEEATRQSEERFRALIQNANDIVLLLDRQGGITYASEPVRRQLGWDPAELVGQFLFGMAHPDDVPGLDPLFATLATREGAAGSVEFRLRRADGEWVWFEHFINNLLHTPGVHGIVLNAHDLTERRRADNERRLLEAQFQEAQKLESLAVLAGGIAHDFNNLLTTILGNVYLALDQFPADSPERENLKGAERAARRAAELCQQMLAYSGGGRFVVQPLGLGDLVREMTPILQSMVPRHVTLRFELDADTPTVEADSTQIRQVILNLVTNAAEAMGDLSGTVLVRVGTAECDREYLASAWSSDPVTSGRYVFLEVVDTGCGMDPPTMARIFDPFFSTKFIGRGLGLPAVLGIVRSHHGAIKVTSEPGCGTTFRVLLPIRT